MSLAAIMLPGVLIGRDAKIFDHDPAALNLDELQRLGQIDNLRLLGRLCVNLVPQDTQQLLDAAGIDTSTGAQEQFAGFTHKRQEDFLLGRTRIVSGWVLAEAECALCVLCAQA
jgi:hypothetical protein